MIFKGKTVLVTGATGFVGSNVVARLIEEGAYVRAFVRASSNLASLNNINNVNIFVGEFGNKIDVQAAVKGVQVVIHCAATGSPDRQEAYSVNLDASTNMFDAALSVGCRRFIHISTTGVYKLSGQAVIDETDCALSTESVYADSKSKADVAAIEYFSRGLPVVVLRPALVLGTHFSSVWGSKVPRAIRQGKFPIAGDGMGIFPYVHIRSLVESILTAALVDSAPGEIINVVDGHSTWIEYVEPIARRPIPSIPLDKAPPIFLNKTRFSAEKASVLLGHTAVCTFEDAVGEINRFIDK